jgi:hypothetical protein
MSKEATISVNMDGDLKKRLHAVSKNSGVAVNTIARAAILAAVEFHDRHGFLTMPVKFATLDVVPAVDERFAPQEVTSLKAAEAPRKKSNGR